MICCVGFFGHVLVVGALVCFLYFDCWFGVVDCDAVVGFSWFGCCLLWFVFWLLIVLDI